MTFTASVSDHIDVVKAFQCPSGTASPLKPSLQTVQRFTVSVLGAMATAVKSPAPLQISQLAMSFSLSSGDPKSACFAGQARNGHLCGNMLAY
jgi:hypothetical protein